MNENADKGLMNALDWLSSEEASKSKQDRISELSAENGKLKLEAEKLKWTTLNEMYAMVSRALEDHCAAYGKKVCYHAEALIRLCFKLRYIDRPAYRSLLHYIEMKNLEYSIQENTEKPAGKTAAFCRAMKKLGLREIKSEAKRGCVLYSFGAEFAESEANSALPAHSLGCAEFGLRFCGLSVIGYRFKG